MNRGGVAGGGSLAQTIGRTIVREEEYLGRQNDVAGPEVATDVRQLLGVPPKHHLISSNAKSDEGIQGLYTTVGT
jgi:hypothetical protein